MAVLVTGGAGYIGSHTSIELLESGKMSVSAIAELAGYENVYYFSNVFKQRVGVPPGQYMRDKIKNHKI